MVDRYYLKVWFSLDHILYPTFRVISKLEVKVKIHIIIQCIDMN